MSKYITKFDSKKLVFKLLRIEKRIYIFSVRNRTVLARLKLDYVYLFKNWMQSFVILLACKNRNTFCMKHNNIKNVLLSMLLQPYITEKIAFNTYNYIFTILNTLHDSIFSAIVIVGSNSFSWHAKIFLKWAWLNACALHWLTKFQFW